MCRNTIFGKLSMKPREASKAAAFDYAKIAVIIFSSVLLGKQPCFMRSFHCGIALINRIDAQGRANIYALPLILGGLLTNLGQAMTSGRCHSNCGLRSILFHNCKNRHGELSLKLFLPQDHGPDKVDLLFDGTVRVRL